jgi:hypothetical protein
MENVDFLNLRKGEDEDSSSHNYLLQKINELYRIEKI